MRRSPHRPNFWYTALLFLVCDIEIAGPADPCKHESGNTALLVSLADHVRSKPPVHFCVSYAC